MGEGKCLQGELIGKIQCLRTFIRKQFQFFVLNYASLSHGITIEFNFNTPATWPSTVAHKYEQSQRSQLFVDSRSTASGPFPQQCSFSTQPRYNVQLTFTLQSNTAETEVGHLSMDTRVDSSTGSDTSSSSEVPERKISVEKEEKCKKGAQGVTFF